MPAPATSSAATLRSPNGQGRYFAGLAAPTTWNSPPAAETIAAESSEVQAAEADRKLRPIITHALDGDEFAPESTRDQEPTAVPSQATIVVESVDLVGFVRGPARVDKLARV